MKPALYDAEGHPTHWHQGSDVFRRVDPGEELKIELLVDVRRPERNLLDYRGRVAGVDELLHLRDEVAAVPERSIELTAERDRLLADIDRLLADPIARRRNDAVDRLGGNGVVSRCRDFLSRKMDIRTLFDGLRSRPVL